MVKSQPKPSGRKSSAAYTRLHNQLQSQILVALSRLDLGLFWSNATGAGTSPDGQWIRYGLVGSSDILGIVNGGYFIAIEVKTGAAVQSPQQIKFEAAVKKRGGYYFVARSVLDALMYVQTVAALRDVK